MAVAGARGRGRGRRFRGRAGLTCAATGASRPGRGAGLTCAQSKGMSERGRTSAEVLLVRRIRSTAVSGEPSRRDEDEPLGHRRLPRSDSLNSRRIPEEIGTLSQSPGSKVTSMGWLDGAARPAWLAMSPDRVRRAGRYGVERGTERDSGQGATSAQPAVRTAPRIRTGTARCPGSGLHGCRQLVLCRAGWPPAS